MKKLNVIAMLIITVMVLSVVSGISAETVDYPPDPINDRAYVNGVNFYTRPVTDLEANFNAARAAEETQLGITLPDLDLPEQAVWDGMDSNAKALFIINDERAARGVPPLTGTNADVTNIAQGFANWLGANDAWGHDQDMDNNGTTESPFDRLHAVPAIGNCHDFLGVSENLSVAVSSSSSFPQAEAVAAAIYGWTYNDSGSSWGHRHALLWQSFTDNSGTAGNEGLMGIGYWSGGPYQGPFGQSYPQAELVVFNVFDPCPTWVGTPTAVSMNEMKLSTTLPVMVGLFVIALSLGTIAVKRRSQID